MTLTKIILIATFAMLTTLSCSHQPTESGGTQSAETIRLTVKKHLRDISECYKQLTATNPNWSGKVIMEWSIDDEGSVSNCKVNKVSGSGGEPLGKCMATKIKNWKFPPSAKDETAAIRYPFVFSPKQ